MADHAGRAILRTVFTTLGVPLIVLAVGIWEMQRGAFDQRDLELQRGYLGGLAARMEARIAADPRRAMEVQFRQDGRLYGGPYAVQKARETLGKVDTALTMSRWRRLLPPVTVAAAGLTALLSVLALAGAALLARAGRTSREALVRGFSLLHRLLPPVLGLQVLLLAICAVTAVTFEAAAILEAGDFSSGSLKMLMLAAVLVGASLWTAISAILQLRRTVALFTPAGMTIHGRSVSAQDAPGLWRLLDDLAARLGALRPDNVVVGMTGGFFVSSGPKLLQPGGIAFAGRTLYLPLPYLPLLQADELGAIIGHELAHFAGSDTEYSLRFVPIYAGVERSLDAVLTAGTTGTGSVSLLTRPALRLGLFAMDRFHHTVMDWSRRREFEADAAGAAVTSTDAAARALLRTIAADGRIDETLETAFAAPGEAPADLVAAVLANAAAKGLDDPTPGLEQRQPHPTDTHPPTHQRLAALGQTPGPTLLAHAALPPAPDAAALLSELFTDPAALCRAATADFLDLAHDHARATREALHEAAAAVDGQEQALHEDPRGICIALFIGAAILLVAGAALLLFGPTGIGQTELRLLGAAGIVAALGLGGWGLAQLRRPARPFLLLQPDGLTLPGLDRAVAWAHVADMDMALDHGRISTRLLLLPEAPFPARRPGGRRVKLDARRRIVSFTAGLPRGMSADDFAQLVGRYRRADKARRALADQYPPPPP